MVNGSTVLHYVLFSFLAEEDESLIPADMTNDCIAQSWYRFLHSLGNPVDLSRPALVSQTQHFYQYAIVAENVIDPTHHPCLSALPSIFLKSMKGIAAMVDAYLGKILGRSCINGSQRGVSFYLPKPGKLEFICSKYVLISVGHSFRNWI